MRHSWLIVLLSFLQPLARTATAADVVFQPLASVTNDRNEHLQRLGVLLVAGRVVGVRFDTINGNNPHAEDFSLDDVKAGAVLEDPKHKALVLHGSIDSAGGNAELVITYLSNVFFGEHKNCRASMVRDESGQWHIVNSYDHKRVDQLFVRTRVWGISTIQGICPR